MEFLAILFGVELFMNVAAVAISFAVFYKIFNLQYQKLYLLIGSLSILHTIVAFVSLELVGFLISSFSFFKKILDEYTSSGDIHIPIFVVSLTYISAAIIIRGIIDGIVLTQLSFFQVEHINYSIREPLVMGLLNIIAISGPIVLLYKIVQNINFLF